MSARTWQLARECWQLPPGGAVMGILNVTPDSFSDGGLHADVESALAHARQMLAAGADMIDVGGESTRPGSAEVPVQEEMRRVLPVIEALRVEFPAARLSIDTRHAEVARAALQAGVDVVNDITGLASPEMRKVCAEMPCGVVLMHMQGEPRTMQQKPQYSDVVAEVRAFFENQLAQAAADGIEMQRLCLDPGIGFGKTVEHNLCLIRELDSLRVMNRPLLMALSRKRFMGALLQDSGLPKISPLPTVVMSLLAADRGADLHRVHDVAELRQALTLRAALL
ncbi:MAG: dihydropteroate synthase [Akkermansiaceae bacterium]|nr:dihydropteroate synthase [Akkermansiaceae bacterium]